MTRILNYAVAPVAGTSRTIYPAPTKHIANDSMDRGVWLDYLTKPRQVSLG